MSISDLTIQDWGIIYAGFLSTAGIVWQAGRLWSGRRRLAIRVGEHYHQELTPAPGGFPERWSVGILIKNRSPKPTRVEAWGIEQPTVGKGPWVTGQGPLPTELPGYGKVQFALDDASLKALMRRPQVIYAEDEREKKWRANRKTVRRAIDLAKLAVERNSKRLPIIQTPRSVFRPAPPESRPPKGRIFGDPKDQ